MGYRLSHPDPVANTRHRSNDEAQTKGTLKAQAQLSGTEEARAIRIIHFPPNGRTVSIRVK